MKVHELLRRVHDAICLDGFALVPVGEDVPGRLWAYTIGLEERFHPELVVAGLGLRESGLLLEHLGGRVLAGERFGPDLPAAIGEVAFLLEPVHPTRIDAGLCGLWEAYYGRTPDPIQVRAPAELLCQHHRWSQPRLDLPGGIPGRSPEFDVVW